MTTEATVDAFLAHVVAMELDAACELVTDDLEYDNVPMGKNYGPDGLRGFLGAMVGGVDELEFVVHRQAASGDVVMNERTDRFRVGEAWFDLPVAGVFELRDGKICLWRDYFDMGAVTQMLAALAG